MDQIIADKELSMRFRAAIESMDAKEFGESTWFSNFPRGCCGDAAELLSKYLIDNNIKTHYVSGMRSGQSHAWLEYDGYIIDITADQFPEINVKVQITKDTSWHSMFREQSREFRDFEINNEFNMIRLRKLYKNIIARIE